MKVSLVPIDRDGAPRGYRGPLPEVTREVFRATTELYGKVGFEIDRGPLHGSKSFIVRRTCPLRAR